MQANEVALRLESHGDLGRTDLEIDVGSHLAVIEAKRGWLLLYEIEPFDKRGHVPRKITV